ncbi:MAG: hypothetical protein NC548_06225 [Lachnospiraceae bacterium]|nr:hypothetical protein [Lachnospiraceae bacterium]
MATNAQGGSVTTIEDFVREYNVETIRMDTVFLRQVFWERPMEHKMVVTESAMIDKYLSEIENDKVSIALSTEEYYKYRYNPKRMAYDVYGTTELWFLIMAANELYSIIDFDLRTVKAYTTAIMPKVDRILNLEHEFKVINDDEVRTELMTPIPEY